MTNHFEKSTPNLLDLLLFIRRALRRYLEDHPVAACRHWIEILGAAMYLRDWLRHWFPGCKFRWIPITNISRMNAEVLARRMGAKMSVAEQCELARWLALLKQHGQTYLSQRSCRCRNLPLPQSMQELFSRFVEYLRSQSVPRRRSCWLRRTKRVARKTPLFRPNKPVCNQLSDQTTKEPFRLFNLCSPTVRGPPLESGATPRVSMQARCS